MQLVKISIVIPFYGNSLVLKTIELLDKMKFVDQFIFISDKETINTKTKNLIVKSPHPLSNKVIKYICERVTGDYIIYITDQGWLEVKDNTIEQFRKKATNSSAGLFYSDYFVKSNNVLNKHSLIDYQLGSIRDDFDFGPLIFLKRSALQSSCSELQDEQIDSLFSGLYQLRLTISRKFSIERISEPLYVFEKIETDKSAEKLFKYVDPSNRELQLEMETTVTHHLKKIGAYLKPGFKNINVKENNFSVEASIIIPVKNRVKTIKDAIESAIAQKTNFNYNIIVVDNHSTDGTTEIVKSLAIDNENVIHYIPQSNELGIGGCWNEAIDHSKCGRFSVQLDSDDIYSDGNTLQKIINRFYEDKCAMVIGSYKLTDFNLNEIPPGTINHKEWTSENGPNNALRINGLGAPRAFYTPVVRKIKFHNVSYGEDYAIGLAVCREYKIGRIYEPIYICRRWEGNTDASLTVEQENENNSYKDFIRSEEIKSRQELNHLKQSENN
ncbi:MAG: glycosyltransferase family 2 protein [Ignavibacteriaceae bacterium]|nr:glycosyltransferase family 2 protein [Ignavibacteriaceae bacterium]